MKSQNLNIGSIRHNSIATQISPTTQMINEGSLLEGFQNHFSGRGVPEIQMNLSPLNFRIANQTSSIFKKSGQSNSPQSPLRNQSIAANMDIAMDVNII
jgi:hypothetical protein